MYTVCNYETKFLIDRNIGSVWSFFCLNDGQFVNHYYQIMTFYDDDAEINEKIKLFPLPMNSRQNFYVKIKLILATKTKITTITIYCAPLLFDLDFFLKFFFHFILRFRDLHVQKKTKTKTKSDYFTEYMNRFDLIRLKI